MSANNDDTGVLLAGDPALHSPEDSQLHALLRQELAIAQPWARTQIIVVFLDAYADQLPTLITAIQETTRVQIAEEKLASIIDDFANYSPIDLGVQNNGVPILHLCILDHQPSMLYAAEVSWHGHALPSQAQSITSGLVVANQACEKILDFWLTEYNNVHITVDAVKCPRMATMGAWIAARTIVALCQDGKITNDTWQDFRRTVDLKLIATWCNYAADEAAAMTIMLYVDKCLAQYDADDGVEKLNKQYKHNASTGTADIEFCNFFTRQLQRNALPNPERIRQELHVWEKRGMAPPTTDPVITVPLPQQLADTIAINSVKSSIWYAELANIYAAGAGDSCCLGPVLRAAERLGFSFAKPAEFLSQTVSTEFIRYFADRPSANTRA